MSISVRSVFPLWRGISGLNPNCGISPGRHAQHGAQSAIRYPPPAAKDIHEQRVRTVRAIQLSPSPARTGRCPARTGMDLREPACPLLIGANVPVRRGIRNFHSLVVFAASEDDAGLLVGCQLVERSGRSRDLLASNAVFPPQGLFYWHWILLESLPAPCRASVATAPSEPSLPGSYIPFSASFQNPQF